MKLFIKIKSVKNLLKNILIIMNNYIYDIKRYITYSTTIKPPCSKNQILSKIAANIHVIEKGLSLRNTRLGFGQNEIIDLDYYLEKYLNQKFDSNLNMVLSAKSVLIKYFEINKKYDFKNQKIKNILKKYAYENNTNYGGYGVEENYVAENTFDALSYIVETRRSIRDFDEEKNVDIELIKKAISLAQMAPSVCNRQGSNVYIIKNKHIINEVISIQNGNRGFGEYIDKLLIVSNDLSIYEGIKERNQNFIDGGGMFSMMLLLSLHSLGLATCCLNWSQTTEKDKILRKKIPIDNSNNIILLIAVGHYKNKFKYAISKRKKLNEIISIL